MTDVLNPNTLAPDLLGKMHAYWRAANYLSVGQIYLQDNPLLESPLTLEDIKPRLLGHWGTTPGLNLLYVHLNRLIKENDLNMIYVTGPGHGGPGIAAQTYLEGSYTERYPAIERNRNGLYHLFRQFSWPYGIPSHVSPEMPGAIQEGGELGYSLVHAYGAAFDNPDLIVACVIGDGEAETGPLATSWHSNKFLNPIRDGAVLPILHLNGFKIANPTVLARIDRKELADLLSGYGYEPHFVEGDDPLVVHQELAGTLDTVLAKIHGIQSAARLRGKTHQVQQLQRWAVRPLLAALPLADGVLSDIQIVGEYRLGDLLSLTQSPDLFGRQRLDGGEAKGFELAHGRLVHQPSAMQAGDGLANRSKDAAVRFSARCRHRSCPLDSRADFGAASSPCHSP
jgi:xylulose-5-phosphate/fructose-6-phosphate phosphoketolase